jgi:hypothetical protein
MSKMGSHDPFGHLQHKLWQKERPRIKLAVCVATHFKASVRMRLALPKVGTRSPSRLLQLQSSIAEVKKPRLGGVLISLERPWSVDVENGLAWAIWTSTAQVMVERRVGSQTGSWTPNHKKSRINLTPVCADGVQHTIEKLLRRATIASDLIPIWSLSRELWAPKVPRVQTETVSGLLFGSPGDKSHLDAGATEQRREYYMGKVVVSPESGPWWVKWIRVAHGLSQHQRCFRKWTNPLVVGFDAGPSY